MIISPEQDNARPLPNDFNEVRQKDVAQNLDQMDFKSSSDLISSAREIKLVDSYERGMISEGFGQLDLMKQQKTLM